MRNSFQLLILASLNKFIVLLLRHVIIPFLERQAKKTQNQIDDDVVLWMRKAVEFLDAKL